MRDILSVSWMMLSMWTVVFGLTLRDIVMGVE
jgi:hypothetical protein